MDNSYQELVDNIIYVEEEPNLTNSTYTFIDFADAVEPTDDPGIILSRHVLPKQPVFVSKDYICGSCDESFVDRKELDDHLKSKHLEIFNLINSYRKNGSNKGETIDTKEKGLPLKPQDKVVIEESYFTCKCGEKFQKFLELEQHVETEHSDEFQTVPDTDDVPVFYCEESNDLIKEEEETQEENIVIIEDTPEVNDRSDDATMTFVTMDQLIAKNATGVKNINRGTHICTYCGAKFYLKSRYLEHMREKHPDNPEFLCEICSKGFFDQYQLKKHKNIHNSKRYVCDICSKGFSTKSKLTTHLDVHFRRNTVDCEICGKTFAAKSGYRVHLKKHLGMWDKNIVCEICNARFRYQYNLDVHMKSHSGQKDFFCEICSKGFALQRHLQAHIDGHNGLRKYSCETCGQKFIRRQTWRRHLITHTGEKAYKCQICNAAYVDRRSLRRHLEKIHPGSNIEAFSKPLPSVPLIMEERNLPEGTLIYPELS